MSLESNKWLLRLNEINQEIWEFTNTIGYDPETLIVDSEDEESLDKQGRNDLKEYRAILERKKKIEKKLEDVLTRSK